MPVDAAKTGMLGTRGLVERRHCAEDGRGAFVAVTLVVVLRASKNTKTAADYYAGGRSFSGTQNGLAIAGDYLSAASFLGIVGAIAVQGYDGFLYSIGFLVAWLVALLLVAELLRNTGKFTMADVLSFRLRQRPVRLAAAISTLVVSLFYLLAQMAGAGGLVALLLDVESDGPTTLTLTRREQDVVTLAALGYTNARIAEELNIGVQTAKGYMKDVLRKLGASSRLEAVVIARRSGLLP